MKLTCSKAYKDFPFAHRQPHHAGHCSHIHGHSWGFTFEFQATSRDACGFVVDFGGLKWLKAFLDKCFDHTLVLNNDDPHLEAILTAQFAIQGNPARYALRYPKQNAVLWGFFKEAKIKSEGIEQPAPSEAPPLVLVLPNCASEGIAEFIASYVDAELKRLTEGRVSLLRLTVHEDSRNSATIEFPSA